MRDKFIYAVGSGINFSFRIAEWVGNFIALACIVFWLSGCIGLPSAAKLPIPGAPAAVGKAVSGSASNRAIQTAVNYTTTLSILGGVACLVFGGLAIYGGQLLPGIKLVIAGLLLPIAGIWYAYHWLYVAIACLVGGAAYILITHFSVVRPALVAVEAWAKTVESRLIPAPKTPLAASAPVPATK